MAKKRNSGGLPPELTTVTPLSKTLSLIAFLTIPIIAFFLGIRYQEAMNTVSLTQMSVPHIIQHETNLVK